MIRFSKTRFFVRRMVLVRDRALWLPHPRLAILRYQPRTVSWRKRRINPFTKRGSHAHLVGECLGAFSRRPRRLRIFLQEPF